MQVSELGQVPSPVWQHVFAVIGAMVIGGAAIARLSAPLRNALDRFMSDGGPLLRYRDASGGQDMSQELTRAALVTRIKSSCLQPTNSPASAMPVAVQELTWLGYLDLTRPRRDACCVATGLHLSTHANR
jgi:hypothetical protein